TSRSIAMVAKPTSRSWDMMDCRHVLITFSLEKHLSPAATVARKVGKILKATERFGKFLLNFNVLQNVPFNCHGC
ncbi:hypothetical protein AVEN_266388-2-1, partial [Araneus ventricosus]